MPSNMSASTKFKSHAFRMIMFVVLFMSAIILMAYAISSLIKTWPKVNVSINLGDNVQDVADDDQKYDPPATDETMYPGGSEVDGGILDSLAQYEKYNEVLRRVSKNTGLGDRMMSQSLKDRRILSSQDDEWDRNAYYSNNVDPATMSKEVTLFNL